MELSKERLKEIASLKDKTLSDSTVITPDAYSTVRSIEIAEMARRLLASTEIIAAAEKLVRCKGRYHSEQNYRALAALFGVKAPDLPPIEDEQQPKAYIVQDKYERLNHSEGHLMWLGLNSYSPEDICEHELSCTPLYLHPQQGKAVQMSCPFPCGWDTLNKLAIQDAAFVALSLVAGEPATESLRQAAIANNDRLLKVISFCRAAMLEPVSNRDGLLFIAENLVNRYLINKDSENESIACIAVSKNTIGTSGVWDDWKALDAALKAHRRASNTD